MGRMCERLADFEATGNVEVKKFTLAPTNDGDVTIVGAVFRNTTSKSVSFVFEILSKVGDDLTSWKELASFRPPITIQQQVIARGKSWMVQPIEDGWGNINFDYYPVYVTQLPAPSGSPMTARALLAYIRMNINSFVDNDYTTFDSYKPSDDAKWHSDELLGAVMYLEIFLPGTPLSDSAVVVASHVAANQWRFSTVQGGPPGLSAVRDRDNVAAHPVSGNREFGFIDNGSGMYTFYTKGAERANRFFDLVVSPLGFRAAHVLWQSLQTKICKFVNENGGCASINRSRIVSKRWSWETVKQNKDIYDISSQLGWMRIPN